MAKSPTAVVSESTKVTTDERKPSMLENYSIYGQTSLFIPLKLFTHLHNFSSSKVNHKEWFVKNVNIRTSYNVSQHYINDASLLCIVAACTGVYPKKHGIGASCYKNRGHVDTVWETKQVYTRITLKSKYITIHGVNHWNSLKANLGNSVSSGITI